MTADAASPDTPTGKVARVRKAADVAPTAIPGPLGEAARRWLLAEADCHGGAADIGTAAGQLVDSMPGAPAEPTRFQVVVSTLNSAVAFADVLLSLSGDSTQTTDGVDPDVLAVLEYVSRGRRYVGVEPYPDFEARRALGRLHDEGSLRSRASGTPAQTGEET